MVAAFRENKEIVDETTEDRNEEGTGVSDTETLTVSDDELVIDSEVSDQEESMETQPSEPLHQKRRKSGRPASSGDEQPPEKQAHLPDTQEMVNALVEIAEDEEEIQYECGNFQYNATQGTIQQKRQEFYQRLTKEDSTFYTYELLTAGTNIFCFPENEELVIQFIATNFRLHIGKLGDTVSDPRVEEALKSMPAVKSQWSSLDDTSEDEVAERYTHLVNAINDEWN